MKKTIKTILWIVIIIIAYNIFLISKSSLDSKEAKTVFGYNAYIITTDSMQPSINARRCYYNN